MEIGKYLTEVKDKVGHGHFLNWIREEFDWSDRTAQEYMRVYREGKKLDLRIFQ
jgi:hypothetical protein